MASSQTRRSAGEGSLFKTTAGTWRAYVTLPDGRRYVSGRTRADAVRKLDALRDGPPIARMKLTTGAYLTTWLDTMRPKVRPRVHQGYATIVHRHLVPNVGRIALARLVAADVERMTAAVVAAGLSTLTARHVRAVLRRALSDAVRQGLVHRNVAALAEPPRVEHREMRALTAAEARRLIAATAEVDIGPLVALALFTGLRQGELLGLAWDDIAGDRLTVHRALSRALAGAPILGETKTPRSRRTIALPPAAVGVLTVQRARQDAARKAAGVDWQDRDGLVFTDALGRPLRHDGVSARFRIAADVLGLPVRFHDLRHSAASMMLAAGVGLHVVSRTLGHSGVSVTADVYGHLADDSRAEAANAMDRALGDEGGFMRKGES